jgi:cell division protein FtsB
MPRRRRPSRSTLALRWLGTAVLVAVAVAYVHPLRSYLHARGEVAKRRAEIAALERESRLLELRLARANDAGFVEREARRLGLVRPGERLFIVKGIDRWRAAERAGKAQLR